MLLEVVVHLCAGRCHAMFFQSCDGGLCKPWCSRCGRGLPIPFDASEERHGECGVASYRCSQRRCCPPCRRYCCRPRVRSKGTSPIRVLAEGTPLVFHASAAHVAVQQEIHAYLFQSKLPSPS
jgi:hypothetical protein